MATNLTWDTSVRPEPVEGHIPLTYPSTSSGRTGFPLFSEASRLKLVADIVERSAQTALSIRAQASPLALAPTIGGSLSAIYQYAGEKGYVPSGPPFVAYHGVDGQLQDIEIGFPFGSNIEGKDSIKIVAEDKRACDIRRKL